MLVVRVPSRLPGAAWQIDGSFLKRAGDDLAAMSAQELRAIFDEPAPTSRHSCPGATLEDLEPSSMHCSGSAGLAKAIPSQTRTGDEQTLRDAELLVEGNQVAMPRSSCSAKAALTRWLAQAELVFEYRSSEAAGPVPIARISRGLFCVAGRALRKDQLAQ
jgi:ATP-dependent DNA helicase RecG